MLLIWHLIIGNLFFIYFIAKRDYVFKAWEQSKKIIAINKLLKTNQLPNISAEQIQLETSPNPKFIPKKWNIFTYFIFYIQFILIAWLLFLSTFASALIIVYLNPKIKELL